MSDKLTFAATHAVPPIVPLCSGKQGDSGPLSDRYRKTDSAAILRELARAKCEFQMRAICAAMGLV